MNTRSKPYQPDPRLSSAYEEANLLNEAGLAAICPSYIELAETEFRFREETLLGSGSLKDVYKCWDCRGKRWVAVARLREDRGPEFYDLFVNEAWICTSLSHPNIIKIHDVGVNSEGRPFFAMDLKGEKNLGHLIASPNHEANLLSIFLKVCEAVAYAHAQGVLHLDIKPENIQADRFGEVLLCDWGLAKRLDDPSSHHDEPPYPGQCESVGNMTLFGEIKGTLGYMAPEQISSGRVKDQRTDIFALGCLLHTLLTGSPPFTASNQKELIERTIEGSFPPPRQAFPNANIPESLEAITLKSCSPNPDDRYQSVAALIDDLENFQQGFATTAEEPGFLRATLLFLRRHRLPAFITLAALVALTISSVLFIQHLGKSEERATRLEDEADTLTKEIAHYGQSEKELSRQLADSAHTLKNLGVFSTPAKSITEALSLAQLALTLDPENSNARYQLFALSCIQLDFETALQYPPDSTHKFGDYIQFARAFPDFAFSRKTRPTPDKLAEFFRKAREINPNRAPLMERILAFDYRTRGRSCPEAVLALVEYLNPNDHPISTHDSRSAALTIECKQSLEFIINNQGAGSGSCILVYLPVRSLTLKLGANFDLAKLQMLKIKSLDLRNCQSLDLSRSVYLPHLREILIRPGQINPNLLKTRLLTVEPVKIIWEDS